MSRANTRFAPASSTSATGNDIYYSGQGGAGGELYFNGQYTSLLNTPAIGNGGADFIMGLPEFLSIGQNVGTRGTGIIRGPGMTEADLGVSKIFQITESRCTG